MCTACTNALLMVQVIWISESLFNSALHDSLWHNAHVFHCAAQRYHKIQMSCDWNTQKTRYKNGYHPHKTRSSRSGHDTTETKDRKRRARKRKRCWCWAKERKWEVRERERGRGGRRRGGREWQRGTMRGSPSICLNAAACPGGREPERVHSGLNKGCS